VSDRGGFVSADRGSAIDAPALRNEFYRTIPVDQLKSVWDIRECFRRCRQGLVKGAVTTFMRIIGLCPSIHFPANEEK